jgi:phosphohistidine phosphatase
MRTLVIMRHAEAADRSPSGDHARVLSPRGRAHARRMAGWLAAQNLAPEVVLCSNAARAVETLEALRPELGDAEIRTEPALYLASPEQVLAMIHDLSASESALVIGHNPGLQIVARKLVEDGPARARLEGRFPPAAVAVLRWPSDDSAVAELVHMVTPAELG